MSRHAYNYIKSTPECTKSRHFQMKNGKKLGRGTASLSGEGIKPSRIGVWEGGCEVQQSVQF